MNNVERGKMHNNQNNELNNFFNKVNLFVEKHIDRLYHLKSRWGDEKKYEDFEDYKKIIIKISKESGLTPCKISKNKISFKYNTDTFVNVHVKASGTVCVNSENKCTK